MHILLTDILACPVCGPEYGLIVRTDTLIDRRIIDGALGCPNCRKPFPISDGVAMLDRATGLDTAGNAEPAPSGGDATTDPLARDIATAEGDIAADDVADSEAAIRMAALLGLGDTGGFALIVGPAARLATDVAGLADRFEIIADAQFATGRSISRMMLGERLPFYGGRLRGIWLSDRSADALLEEAARTLHPLGRLVLDPAPVDATARLEAVGLKIAAVQDSTILAIQA